MSVSTAPGLRATAVTPHDLPSTAVASVSPITPYFVVLYAARPGNFSVAYTPDSEAMLTMRPPSAFRIIVKAARQQLKTPVRLTLIVYSHDARLISSKGSRSNVAAAHTRAAGGPMSLAMLNNSLTAPASLTSVGTAVACPPESRIDATVASRPATPLAATIACAPSRAIASAVARPIPRLAPVMTATRPASQCSRSATCSHSPRTAHAVVDALVCVEHRFDVEVRLGVSPARAALDVVDAAERRSRGGNIAWSHKEPGDAVEYDILESTAPERDHRGRARLRFGGNQTERLAPAHRTEHCRRTGDDAPEHGPGNRLVDGDPGLAACALHLPFSVAVVVGVSVQVDRHSGAAGNRDRLGSTLLGAEAAREYNAGSWRGRPRDSRGGDAYWQHEVDVDEPLPRLRLRPRDRGNHRWIDRL